MTNWYKKPVSYNPYHRRREVGKTSFVVRSLVVPPPFKGLYLWVMFSSECHIFLPMTAYQMFCSGSNFEVRHWEPVCSSDATELPAVFASMSVGQYSHQKPLQSLLKGASGLKGEKL